MDVHFRVMLFFLTALTLCLFQPATVTVAEAEEEHIEHVRQALQCQPDPTLCPQFLSHETWSKSTAECCGQDSSLTFHAQRTDKGGCIFACLPTRTCPHGTYVKIHEYNKDKDRYAYIRCEPCEKGTFQLKPQQSYRIRVPTCPDRHQWCPSHLGKTLVMGGNASHDATCRCLWEEGFAPFPNISVCASPSGFVTLDNCYCQKSQCHDGLQLNNEYKCVEKPSTTKEPESTTPGEGKIETSTHKPGTSQGDAQEVADEEEWGWMVYFGFLVTVLLGSAIFIIFKFHP